MTRARPFPNSQLELDDEHSAAFWKGQKLELPPESYLVLSAIAHAPNTVHTVNDILEAARLKASGPGRDEVVARQIQRIQFAFAKISYSTLTRGPIKVIVRQGYKWNEQLQPRWKLLARLFNGARTKTE